jgi:flagellar hook-length control protein FliK
MKAAGLTLVQTNPPALFKKSGGDQHPTNSFLGLVNKALQAEQSIASKEAGKKQDSLALLEKLKQLFGQLNGETPLVDPSSEANSTEEDVLSLLDQLTQAERMELNAFLSNQEAMSELTGTGNSSLLEMVQHVLLKMKDAPLDNRELGSIQEKLVSISSAMQSVEKNDLKSNQEILASLWNKALEILQKVEGQAPTKEQEAGLRKLLEQWTAVEKQTGKANGFTQQLTGSQTTQKEQAVWNQLLQTYQNRTKLVGQQKYATNATVTTTDIGKWVSNALSRYKDEKGTQLNHTVSQQPISKLEQFVIHINQTSNHETMEKQVMQEFQRVIKASKFLQKDGMGQLSIRLNPTNMGEMVVKLTQINGEMAVKIAVSSQMAKDMLEGNLQQLRHIFSPHQVVIEKTDVSFSNESNAHEYDESFEESQGDQQQQKEHEQDGDKSQSELSFHDILNEKV